MRGFPLIGALAVAMAFALAWWPLQRLLSAAGTTDEPAAPAPLATMEDAPETETAPLSLRVYATAPMNRLLVEHLGQPVMDRETPVSTEITEPLPGVALPPEGVEFWIEATLAPAAGAAPRAALAVELIAEGQEPLRRTLWTDEAGAIADTVVFHPDAMDQP